MNNAIRPEQARKASRAKEQALLEHTIHVINEELEMNYHGGKFRSKMVIEPRLYHQVQASFMAKGWATCIEKGRLTLEEKR